MVARLGCSARREEVCRHLRRAPLTSQRYQPTLTVDACLSDAARRTSADDLSEYRFVALLRHLGRVEPPPRASLVRTLNEHFAPPGPAAVSCDLLKGRPLERLSQMAVDFD